MAMDGNMSRISAISKGEQFANKEIDYDKYEKLFDEKKKEGQFKSDKKSTWIW